MKIVAVLALVLAIHSCQVDEGQRFVQSISEDYYHQAVNVNRTMGADAAQQYADSLYYALANPTPVDYWRKRLFDAYLSDETGQHDRSLEIVDSLIAYIEDPSRYAGMQSYLALTFLHKGDIYNNYLFQNDRAYTNYVRARIIGLDLEDRCLTSAYDARFAIVLYRRQNYLDAVNYFQKALSNYDGCDDNVAHFTREQRWIDDIAISYAKAGRYDSAMVYHDQALNYIRENRFDVDVDSALVEMAQGVIYGNKAQTLVALGRLDEAEPLYRRSIELNGRTGFDINDANLARLHLSNLLMSIGRTDEVGALIAEVESYTQRHPNPTTIARMLDTRSRFRQLNGIYQLALQDRLLQNQLQDSLTRANMMVFDTDATSEYNYILAQQEVERLKNDNQLRTLWLFGGSIVFSLFAVVLLLFFYAWRQSKRSMTLLHELNEQISKQKQELESTVQQLRDASIEKDRIMWMVAHDLRNPLGAIDSLAQLLELEPVSEDGKELMNQIRFATRSAQKFIGDILTLADEDRIKVDARITDIEELIYRTVEMMQFRARDKGQQLIYDGLGFEKMVRIDPEKITRAVFNLIGNAVKFSPKGADIVVSLKDTSDKVAISVVDRGIGVPTDMREAIFESFTKAKRSGTSGEKPYGLGLSIAKSIVVAHRGDLKLSDNPEGGSIFTIELPTS